MKKTYTVCVDEPDVQGFLQATVGMKKVLDCFSQVTQEYYYWIEISDEDMVALILGNNLHAVESKIDIDTEMAMQWRHRGVV
jgi:hypothetical protein